MQFPAYPAVFCPAGVERPAHIRAVHCTDVVDGAASPSGTVGRLWSSATIDKIAAPWHKTDAGWYVALGDCNSPRKFSRLRMLSGTTMFTEDGLPFIVPKLLRFDVEGGGLFSEQPQKYKDGSWKDPEHLSEIMERLRAAIEDSGNAASTPANPDALKLAIDILSLNYHMSIHEFSILGWIDTVFVERVLLAAGGYADLQAHIAKALDACPAK